MKEQGRQCWLPLSLTGLHLSCSQPTMSVMPAADICPAQSLCAMRLACAVQFEQHFIMLAASGLITIGEYHGAAGLLHAKWTGISPAHKGMWDTIGAELLRQFLCKLPNPFIMVQPISAPVHCHQQC